MSGVDDAVAAIGVGLPVVLPFDTVYGLAADPLSEEASRRLYLLKGREGSQPSALVARRFGDLVECVPELRGDAEAIAQALLPGAFTLVFANPEHRFPWLTGSSPGTIGVRVPLLEGPGGDVLERVGVLVATSANHPGERDPASLGEVPEDVRARAGAVVDGGRLAGVPSTVIDLSGPEPRLLREGAVSAAEALGRVASARSGV